MTSKIILPWVLSYAYTDDFGETHSDFRVYPNVSFNPRYYVTMDKRERLGRRTDYMSGGYVSFPITIGLTDSRYYAGPLYGFQRTLGKRGYWNIGIGLGVKGYKGQVTTDFIGEFGLGFILN